MCDVNQVSHKKAEKGEGFLPAETKLHEMDRSSVRIFPVWLLGGAFLPAEPKLLEIAWNGQIQSQNFSLFGHWGGGTYYGDQFCSKCI